MFWVYIIDNFYCVVDKKTNLIVSKFKTLDEAVNFIKNNKTSSNNIKINNDNNINLSSEELKNINNNFEKINKRLEQMQIDEKNLYNEFFLIKTDYNKENKIVDIRSANISNIIFNDDNLNLPIENIEFKHFKTLNNQKENQLDNEKLNKQYENNLNKDFQKEYTKTTKHKNKNFHKYLRLNKYSFIIVIMAFIISLIWLFSQFFISQYVGNKSFINLEKNEIKINYRNNENDDDNEDNDNETIKLKYNYRIIGLYCKNSSIYNNYINLKIREDFKEIYIQAKSFSNYPLKLIFSSLNSKKDETLIINLIDDRGSFKEQTLNKTITISDKDNDSGNEEKFEVELEDENKKIGKLFYEKSEIEINNLIDTDEKYRNYIKSIDFDYTNNNYKIKIKFQWNSPDQDEKTVDIKIIFYGYNSKNNLTFNLKINKSNKNL